MSRATKIKALVFLKEKDFITSTNNEYNDYYQDEKIQLAGIAKHRPAIIIRIYSHKYYLLIFATNAIRYDKRTKKNVHKGSFKLNHQGKMFYFNLSNSYIFNKKILESSYGIYIDSLNGSTWFSVIFDKTMESMYYVDRNKYDLTLSIIDAILAEDFELADQLIDQQFAKPTKEDILKRKHYKEKRKEFLKNKKKS